MWTLYLFAKLISNAMMQNIGLKKKFANEAIIIINKYE